MSMTSTIAVGRCIIVVCVVKLILFFGHIFFQKRNDVGDPGPGIFGVRNPLPAIQHKVVATKKRHSKMIKKHNHKQERQSHKPEKDRNDFSHGNLWCVVKE